MNTLIKRLFLTVILLIAASCSLSAQNLSVFKDAVSNHFNNTGQEKLFVHTDKSVYLPGEIIWFKIYSLSQSQSKVAYVEVLDNEYKPLLRAKTAMLYGGGSGSLYIPVNASSGVYRLRAYTNWMKNFSPDDFFEKEINIVNPMRTSLTKQNTEESFNLQFFPEGGNMVEGISGKVAFKAVGKDGKGLNIIGVVVNSKNDTVAKFKSLKFGMGQFIFKPVAGQEYQAILRDAQNSVKVVALPKAKTTGYALSVTERANDINVNVFTNEIASGNISLIVHNGKQVSVAINSVLINGTAVFNVNQNDLKDGISQFTIFDKAGRPLNERLYFKRPLQRFFLEASVDAAVYGLRKKVNVNLSAKNERGKLQQSDLSVSVYRIDSLQTVEDIDVVNYSLLTADLKGNIESPGYYFSSDTPEINEALDNLMLTQGWRRFKWETALKQEQDKIKYLPELQGHLITGIMTGKDGTPAAHIIAYMGIPGKRIQYYSALSDSSGRFFFNTKDFYGPNEIVVQTNYEIDSNYKIEIESPFSEKISSAYAQNTFNYLPQMASDLISRNLGVQVQNVYLGINNRRFFTPRLDSVKFYVKPSESYALDDFVRFPTMEEVLREYVGSVNLIRRQKRPHLKVMTNSKGLMENDPLILLDGVPYFNIDKIMEMDPLKINKLEVLKERFYYGVATADGILSFNTPKYDLNGIALDPHAVVLDYEGMQLQREFYNPVYDTELKLKNPLPDFRNVLYWSPDIFTDQNGTGRFSFYTSDQPGNYIGVIQGLNSDGIPGCKYFKFDVK